MADKPTKPPKPFLGEEELSSELDAWDNTFDALHTGPEGGAPATEEVMAWPKPAPATRVPEPALAQPEASRTFDDLPADLDEQMTLDAVIEESTLDRPVTRATPSTSDADPAETDFSDVGAQGVPSALGAMLGNRSGGTAPPIGDDDADETRLTHVERRGYERPGTPNEEDDQVYTSASRPNVKSYGDEMSLPDDPIAPPPMPPPVAIPRTTSRRPAIIRRTPVSIPIQKPPPGYDSGDFGGDENTKIANIEEMEQRAKQSRHAEARHKAPTAPPPVAAPPPPDDDYEIEIGAEAGEALPEDSGQQPAAEPAAAPRRTVAHVVRRTPAAGVPLRHSASIPTAEVSDERSSPVPVPVASSEDDFSDVAAAVGATEDLPVADPELPRRRPSTPRGDRSSDIHRAEPEPLDAIIDDQAPTRLAPEELHDQGGLADVFDHALPVPELEEAPDRGLPTLAHSPRNMRTLVDEPLDDLPRGLPTLVDAGRGSQRPPALVDLYPRVKTPTSVPPLGQLAEEAQHAGLDENASHTLLGLGTKPKPRSARLATPIPDYVTESADVEPAIDLEAIGADSPWPEQLQPFPSSQLDEDFARSLLIYEREVSTVDDSAASAALRVEAGRLCERLGDNERARSHYDAALLADPRATAALRGLRRIARSQSDLAEATRQLDAEITVAGALERRPLGHYRIDLLLASGEQDLARVAAGEILDSAPSDVRALLAQLELAFLDGRADEFGSGLEQLAHAMTDNELRAAVQSARAMLAAHNNDTAAAATWFAAAADSDPGALGARLGAVRHAAQQADGNGAARSLVDLARQIETTDPITAAAMAVRAQQWTTGETAAAAAQLASQAMPNDPLVARITAETAAIGTDSAVTGAAFAQWAASQAPPAERAYAAGRAAELDPARAAELWSLVLELDPGDDYAAAQLRTAHVAADAPQLAIAVDLAVAADVERDRSRLRAAFGLIGQGELEAAIELLTRARTERPNSLALAEALAESLAAAGRWTDRAKLLAALASEPGDQLDRDVAQLRSALAWEEAVGASAEANDAELGTTTASALTAWERVLERDKQAPTAHAAAIVLAHRLNDRDVLAEVLARAQAAERSPWAAASLALRRARLLAGDDPARAENILGEFTPPGGGQIDDPRIVIWRIVAAARRRELGDAAMALEERATLLGSGTEVAALRLRAAQLALDSGDAAKATSLLREVEDALPNLGVIPDLLAAARRRAGDRSSGPQKRIRRDTPPPTGAQIGDEFSRIVRDADLASAQNDGSAAVALYQHALELRPGDPLASVPLIRVATQLREPAPIAALALAQLRAAETAGDANLKAEAYELLAHIDKELRSDSASAQIALESASQADPARIDLMHRLEREYTVADNIGELMRLRRAELDQIAAEFARDRAAIIMDTAVLAERDQRPDAELTELYRAALSADPRRRLALLYLESIVRRAGASSELAQLEDQIAAYFDGDLRTQAAFFTRAGETLAEIGQIDAAVQKFGKAEQVLPGHVPALEGWRHAALKGQLWIDVAEASTRQAAITGDLEVRAKQHHFAGVVLMDKALINEQAQVAFRKALEADPSHSDAFIRLRILLEEDGNHDELAILLTNRLDYETDPKPKIELHRAVAELHRNFLDSRDVAKTHYREILAADPNDLRAHAAVADIAWEQGSWQEAADALIMLAKLHSDPVILTNLCSRLGMLYADRLGDLQQALKAFQRALTYQPDDETTLTRLADLATQVGEWKLALGACERLVKSEQVPDKRATHLHRVAKIFRQGFNDMKRAERALNLALDGAPTNDDALTELVKFYRDAGDMTSLRVHLNRVTGTMRARVQTDPKDGVAYRVIARAMAARANAGVEGSLPIARAAAELAQLLGNAGEPEQLLLSEPPRIDLSHLTRPDADDVLFPRGVQTELRQIFHLLGDRVAKHVGVDLRAYGVGRGDRLRARDSAVASQAQDVATGLGFGEIDVYVSSRQPYAMVAEPTSPVSLVLGSAIAQGDPRGIRFASGSGLKLAQASLAIPTRLAAEDLGVLVVALMRLFQTDFPSLGLAEELITTQTQKLRRLIPTGLSNELKPYALAIDSQRFHYTDLSRDLRITGLRAGLVASGSLLSGLAILAAQAQTDVPSFLADPVAQGLVTFALAEDHAAVAR